MLPKGKGLRYRKAKRSFWRSLLGGQPRRYSIDEDLQIMREFTILTWPDPAKELPLAFVAPGTVVACYDVPYVWFEGGVTERDNLRMEIFLGWRQDRWELLLLRLYGKGIPDS